MAKTNIITSENTSLNQVPGGFRYLVKNISLKDKHCNFDVGGGKYDTGTKFLEKHGVLNLIYDPYARPSEQNRRTLESLQEYPADSATVLNVLNVIPDKEERLETMRLALSLTDGPILLAVYEKKKNGVLELTTKGWQIGRAHV